jgi:hypothetical protein
LIIHSVGFIFELLLPFFQYKVLKKEVIFGESLIKTKAKKEKIEKDE